MKTLVSFLKTNGWAIFFVALMIALFVWIALIPVSKERSYNSEYPPVHTDKGVFDHKK